MSVLADKIELNDVEIIDDVPQGSPEWMALRIGLMTASNFGKVMAQGDGKVRDLYLRQLAGEIATGEPHGSFKNARMDYGSEIEQTLRATFAIETGLDLRQVAFVRRRVPFGIIGASPDALIGATSGLEIKSAEPHILIDILRRDRVPPEHMPQIQGNMLITGRTSWWAVIGWPGLPLYKRKVALDPSYCARLMVGLQTFQTELDELVAWLRRYGKD